MDQATRKFCERWVGTSAIVAWWWTVDDVGCSGAGINIVAKALGSCSTERASAIEINLPMDCSYQDIRAGYRHGSECFCFGMPRRIRLIFQPNVDRRPCDLTGEIDDVVVTGFIMQNLGVNYGVWQHPLTPYRQRKLEKVPVRAPQERVGYEQWLVRSRAAACLAWKPKDFPYPVGYRCALRDPDGYMIELSYGQPLGLGAVE